MGSSHGVGVVSGGVRGRELFDSKQWGAPLRNVNMGKESVGSPAFSCELGMWRAEPRTPLFYFIQIFRLVQLHDTDRSVASLHERSLIVHTSLPWIKIIHLYRKCQPSTQWEYYSALNRKGILTHAMTWRKPGDVVRVKYNSLRGTGATCCSF